MESNMLNWIIHHDVMTAYTMLVTGGSPYKASSMQTSSWTYVWIIYQRWHFRSSCIIMHHAFISRWVTKVVALRSHERHGVLNHWPLECLFSSFFMLATHNWIFRIVGPWWKESTSIDRFPSQRASKESVSMSWHHRFPDEWQKQSILPLPVRGYVPICSKLDTDQFLYSKIDFLQTKSVTQNLWWVTMCIFGVEVGVLPWSSWCSMQYRVVMIEL